MGSSKSKRSYVCSECGAGSSQWQGQCQQCQAWNTLVEGVPETTSTSRYAALAGQTAKVKPLADFKPSDHSRLSTGNEEFDRVLGGGLVTGGVVLIGGDPGIGKSTLLLQAMAEMAGHHTAIYVSGEESGEQVALRAERLQLRNAAVQMLPEISLERILAEFDARRPEVVVIDSIQTLFSEALQSAPGSVAQVRECASHLTRYAKRSGCCVILVGHVTKEGALAGPRVLEHMVDTVLYFEGDGQSSFRLVRAVKNRFGAAQELAVFAMTDRGLRGVSNPSAIFLSQHGQDVAGSCVLVTQEGSRPLLVEVQALVDAAHTPNPRRLCVGLEQNRLAMLLAVLHRHAKFSCADHDVFVNAVGGVKVSEPAADLAVCYAIVSSLTDQPLRNDVAVFGEVGLAGEIRPAPRGQERLKEAAKLGFTTAVVPAANAPKTPIPGMHVIPVERIDEALRQLRALSPRLAQAQAAA